MRRVRLFARVERRQGEIDVVIHGVVAHAVAVLDNRTEAHDAVRLRWNLVEKHKTLRLMLVKTNR